MKFKKSLLIICMLICLFAMANVSAINANDTAITSEDTGETELSHEIESIDNLEISEEEKVTQTDNNEIIGEGDVGTLKDLRNMIREASPGDTLILDRNYSCEESWGMVDGIQISQSNLVIDGKDHTIDAKSKTRIFFVYRADNVTIKNIKFINCRIDAGTGGAIYWYKSAGGSVSGCSFVNCHANQYAGAIDWSESAGGSVSGCSFVNCHANQYAGAIDWSESAGGSVSGCSFIGNTVNDGDGGAIRWTSVNGKISDCIFINNTGRYNYLSVSASLDCNWFGNTAENYDASPTGISGAPLDNWLFLKATVNPGVISTAETTEVIFKLCLYNGNSITDYTTLAQVDLTLNSNGNLDKNVAGLYEKITFTPTSFGTGNITATIGNVAYTTTFTINKGNSTLTINDNIVFDYGTSNNVTVTTKGAIGITAKINDKEAVVENNTIIIPVLDAGTYTLTVTTIADSIHNNITKNALITVNKCRTELTADATYTTYNSNDDLVITLKDDKGKALSNQLLFVDLNGIKIFITDSNGQVKVSTHGLDAKTYTARIVFSGDDNYKKSNAEATVIVNKDDTQLSADAITTTYNINKYLVISLKDSNGKSIKGVKVTVVLNSKTYTTTTDANGQVKVSTKGLAPKTYTATITFNGNNNYAKTTTTAKVTVKKATPKLTAKAKTFKKSVKTKKYTVTLKDNNGKAMAKVKLTLKVKGKTYKATTNAKGKAVFKIKKLTKKGTFKAKVKFAGNTYYNAVTKTVKIKIK